MNILELIKFKRKQRKITQKEIAKLLNLSPSTYNEIENGKINLKADDLIKLINFLDINLYNANFIELSKEEENSILSVAKKIEEQRNQNKHISEIATLNVNENNGEIYIAEKMNIKK